MNARIKNVLTLLQITAVIALLSLAACGRQQTASSEFTLRAGNFLALDNLPLYVIQEQKLDRNHGFRLEMEKNLFPGGAAIIEAIAAGSVDLGTAGSVPVISAAANKKFIPSKVLAIAANNFADPYHPASGVVVASNVRNWKDIEGKFIAVNAVTGITAVALKGRLKLERVQDYKLVQISLANMGLAVRGGNVAAAAMYEPFLSQSLLRRDGKLLGWVIGGPPFERMESSLIVLSADLYRNKPNTVKAFLRAQLEAAEWINRNPDRARSLLSKRMDLSTEVGQTVRLLRWPVNARNDPASLEQIQTVMMDVGMLEAKVPASQLYDETLLQEVLKEKY